MMQIIGTRHGFSGDELCLHLLGLLHVDGKYCT